MTDLDIAKSAKLKPIVAVAADLDIAPEELEQYGPYKAKLDLKTAFDRSSGKLILVSALNPTPPGEGKTTTSIGLVDALNHLGKKTVGALREPSLGPVFGMKGGATGGGKAQVVPMEDINLHFTGDFAAIEKAHNLLAALIDNAIHHRLTDLDPRTVAWKRVVDLNDRSLRQVLTGLGGMGMGVPRESGFDITAASEVMAILCMASDREDLKKRLGQIFVGYTYAKRPLYARDFKAQGAMAALLKDAFKPNLVQTLENNPIIMHGGPFANIAQGTNSVVATKMALRLGDYAVTEAGFGFDLGGEKFLNLKCRTAGLAPELVVLVVTIRALKYHGSVAREELNQPNLKALEMGLSNLERHLQNAKKFGLPAVVAINRFTSDTDQELAFVQEQCEAWDTPAEICDHWAQGGTGAVKLAETVLATIAEGKNDFQLLYGSRDSLVDKIRTVAREIYGAREVQFSDQAQRDCQRIEALKLDELPVCLAKTQYSFSDNPKAIGAPKDFVLHIRQVELAAGAGFVVPITGTMMRMPGLPKEPAAHAIDIDAEGSITGLF